ncbi:hypothetical protein TNCV_1204621 [Trichonephila clavipes]|nr:hypothetical protein TNCV_1204621 [Trichonephila clavipes]
MFTIRTMHRRRQKCNDKSQEFFEVVAAQDIAQLTPSDEGLSDAFKQIQCSGDDPGHEIVHCSHQCLIHKRFQIAPKEEI